MFFWSSMYIGKHFELLSNSFDGDKKKFVQRHQSIFEVAEDLRQFIKPIIFIQFLTYALKLCCTGIFILQSGEGRRQIFEIGIILAQMFQYCYGTQYLLDKSLAVASPFYSNDKDLLIIIARAQKPFAFKAWFYEVNLELVTLVVHSTFSLMAVLRNFI